MVAQHSGMGLKKRILGRTGLEVSELALGGQFVSNYEGTEYEQSRAAILRALELGINYIDTAPTYANSEEVIGKALEGVDAPLVLSTKVGGRPDPFDPKDKRTLMESVKESLRLLKRDHIDILMIHEPDRPGQRDWWTDYENFNGPVMEALDSLKKEGVIRYTGLGGTTAYEIVPIIKTGKFDVLLTAFNYNILWREAAIDAIPAAKEQNMGIVIGSPLQQGALSRRFDDEVRTEKHLSSPRRTQVLKLYALLDEVGMSLPEMAIRFVISNPDISCTLTGSRSKEEVEKNVAAVQKGPLPPDLLKRVDEIAAMVPFRPFEERVSFRFGAGYHGPGGLR